MTVYQKLFNKLSRLLLKKNPPKLIRFNSFEDALTSSKSNGYANIDLIAHVLKKNILFRDDIANNNQLTDQAIRVMPALIASFNITQFNVLDFGGGGGAHFNALRSILRMNKNILWCVVETEDMVLGAQQCGLENENLRFFSTLKDAKACAGSFDLVFTSSALQYCENPVETLKQLISLRAKYIYITRTPFINGVENFITIQKSRLGDNGPGPNPGDFSEQDVYYPITYLSKDYFLETLLEKYELRFEFKESAGIMLIDGLAVEMPSFFATIRE